MNILERRHGTRLAHRGNERAGALLKLGALLMLVLLMADLGTRQVGLFRESAAGAAPGTATTSSLRVQVGDFRAEIQWHTVSAGK